MLKSCCVTVLKTTPRPAHFHVFIGFITAVLIVECLGLGLYLISLFEIATQSDLIEKPKTMAASRIPTVQSIPETMKAYNLASPSLPPKGLALSALPTPKVTKDTILIRISHASLSPGTLHLLTLLPKFTRKWPSIPELDFSGRICAIGSSILSSQAKEQDESKSWKVGDLVFGSIPVASHLKGTGTLAGYVLVKPEWIEHVPVPPALAGLASDDGGIGGELNEAIMKRVMAEAASLPVSGCTALALFNAAKLEGGERVLVHGAAGGVGSSLVQMVRHRLSNPVSDPDSHGEDEAEREGEGKGRLVAVCSSSKSAWVRTIVDPLATKGEVIVYDELPPPYHLHTHLSTHFGLHPITSVSSPASHDGDNRFDVVIDCYGSEALWQSCPQFLKPSNLGGRFITVGPAATSFTRSSTLYTLVQMARNIALPVWAGGTDRRYIQVASTVDKGQLGELKGMIEQGGLRGVLHGERNDLEGDVFEWEKVEEAYDVMKKRGARGKVVVRIG